MLIFLCPWYVSFVPIPRVILRKAIARASVDSTVTAGCSIVRFPSSVLYFRLSDLPRSLRLHSLAG